MERMKLESELGTVNHVWQIENDGLLVVDVCNKHSIFTGKRFVYNLTVVDLSNMEKME